MTTACRLLAVAFFCKSATAFVQPSSGHLRANQPAVLFEHATGQSLPAEGLAPAGRASHTAAPAATLAAAGLAFVGVGVLFASSMQAFRRRAVRRQAIVSRFPMEVGICFPMTEKFDPLNLGSTDAKMERYTAVEVKHGRVAMIAVIGYLVPELFRFPGCESFENGLGAMATIPTEGWLQLLAFVGAHEVLVKPVAGGMGPWDLGFGSQFLEGISDSELIRRQTVERNNGRLAMLAALGLMWQDGTFGVTPIQLWKMGGLYGPAMDWLVKDVPICMGSSLCACVDKQRRSSRTTMRATTFYGGPDGTSPLLPGEKPEMSPSMPFLVYPQRLKGWVGGEKGFDPLGVTDALPVYFVREAELKHGRIAMLASIGWIATDLGVRFPGEVFQQLSTIEAHDTLVDSGLMGSFLGAIATFEVYSWWLFKGGYHGEIQREAGQFYLGAQFMPADEEAAKSMKLKEIENGRLAMVAFGGIATQAVLTGKPWPFL